MEFSRPEYWVGSLSLWSSVAYWAPTDLGSSSFSILSFAFSYCSRGSQGKNTEVVCHPFSSGPHSVRPLPMTRPSWVAPTAWLSFTELDTAVVLGSDWLVFCDCGFSVSALWCPLATPTVLPEFLLPRTWPISSPQRRRCRLPWTRGIFSRPPLLTLNVE